MEQQYQNNGIGFGGTEYFVSADGQQPQPVTCAYDLEAPSAFNTEWFQPTLHPHPPCLSSVYQPLPYLDGSPGAMSHFGPGPLVEVGNAPIAPPPPTPSATTSAAVAQTSPGWDLWSCSEGSQSPAEEKEEDVWEPEDLRRMGYLDASGSWRCRFAGCRSTRVFIRACDLRKHYRGHDKFFFCAEKPCVKAGVGFATRKDYQRHMGSHQPTIQCPHPDCGRVFSRKDNMREHFKKVHLRLRNNLFPRPCRRPRRGKAPTSPGIKQDILP
ncbi:C2H2 type zinc finger protein [Colletotrichum sojae]|uniref:C2H2 type zinc finger protein n=1 Tax=Colletotrichum sojae TaxID=2175907 RepID=A0A8H6IQD5_9PEZI|nr:C2H2 type zinc finger protein [Colletotrichum sojae]